MIRHLVKILMITSAVFLVLSLYLMSFSFTSQSWPDHVSLSTDVHLCVIRGRLAIYNNADYGPYCGSIIALGDRAGHTSPEFLERTGFGDTWGIYYRYFRTAEWTLWTLKVSLMYPIIIFAALPVVWLVRTLVARRRRRANG
jgi:hypothetical protein